MPNPGPAPFQVYLPPWTSNQSPARGPGLRGSGPDPPAPVCRPPPAAAPSHSPPGSAHHAEQDGGGCVFVLERYTIVLLNFLEVVNILTTLFLR